MATVDINAKNQAEAVHAGVNAAVCKVSLSVSWSSGDVHRIGKLPHGAIPLQAVFYPGPASGTGFVAKFGTSATQEVFFASASFSLAPAGLFSTRRLGYGMQISISDDAVALWEWVTMVATAGCSVGYVGDLVVFYKMPGQAA